MIDYIGESTSCGYFDGTDHPEYAVPFLLQEALGFTVNNLSRDSVTVDWVLGIKDGDESILEPPLLTNPPGSRESLAKSDSDIVIINLGINDAINVSSLEFAKDLSQLIENCQQAGKQTYIVIPNAINPTDNIALASLANIMHSIGGTYNVQVIGGEPAQVPLCDEYHPTSIGYSSITAEILPFIQADSDRIANSKLAVELYIALLNTAPEYVGMNYWATELETKPRDVVADSFVTAVETYVGTITTQEFLTDVYHNLFNRGVDLGGAAYWSNEIEATSRGTVLNRIIDVMSTDLAPQIDQDTFHNKVSVGMSNGFVYENDVQINLAGVTSDFNTVFNY